jgi:hypothetical protein
MRDNRRMMNLQRLIRGRFGDMKKHRATIRKGDSLATADKKVSQSREDIRFAVARAPMGINRLAMSGVGLNLELRIPNHEELCSPNVRKYATFGDGVTMWDCIHRGAA